MNTLKIILWSAGIIAAMDFWAWCDRWAAALGNFHGVL